MTEVQISFVKKPVIGLTDLDKGFTVKEKSCNIGSKESVWPMIFAMSHPVLLSTKFSNILGISII